MTNRREGKAATAVKSAQAPRATESCRRFVRDARPAASYSGSGAFWYRIWRNLR